LVTAGALTHLCLPADVWCLSRCPGALSAHGDPLLDEILRCTGRNTDLGLGPEAWGQESQPSLGHPEREARVLGEEVGPVPRYLLKIGHGRVQVIDHSPGSMPPRAGRYARQNELVSRAHVAQA
jgi:hypothetical protein